MKDTVLLQCGCRVLWGCCCPIHKDTPKELERIEVLDDCWCGGKIDQLTRDSEQEIIIRRYIGGQGHLIDLAYHPKCYAHWSNMFQPKRKGDE